MRHRSLGIVEEVPRSRVPSSSRGDAVYQKTDLLDSQGLEVGLQTRTVLKNRVGYDAGHRVRGKMYSFGLGESFGRIDRGAPPRMGPQESYSQES